MYLCPSLQQWLARSSTACQLLFSPHCRLLLPPAPELAKVVVKGLEADSVILRKELFRGQHGIGVVYTLFL